MGKGVRGLGGLSQYFTACRVSVFSICPYVSGMERRERWEGRRWRCEGEEGEVGRGGGGGGKGGGRGGEGEGV